EIPSLLLGVELDDELLLHGRVDLRPLGLLQNFSGQSVVVGLEPRRHRGHEIRRVADRLLRGRVRRDGDDLVGLDLVARAVHAAAVDLEMAVADELARRRPRRGEAEPVDDVVEPELERAEQVVTRDSGPLGRLLVVRPELLLEQPVIAARLLLLAQLEQVLALLDPAAAVLARRVRAALDRALLRQTALALEEELHALPPTEPALRSEIAGH